jgi:zinc protease
VGYATGLKYDATGEYYKTRLMNHALGGDFNSRLNLNLREDKGWTYGARSSFSADNLSGEFQFSSGIRADATDSALVEVMNELKNYSTNGITETELGFIKNSLGQRDALLYETPGQKAVFIRRILDYNLPANYIDQQNKILANITKKEIDAMAKKMLKPEKINILLVGDKAKIYDGVKKLGYQVVELDVDGKPVEKKAF